MPEEKKTAADILADVGGALYGEDAQAQLASLLGVPGRVLRDTMRGHGGLSAARLLEVADARAAEMTRLRDMLKARVKGR